MWIDVQELGPLEITPFIFDWQMICMIHAAPGAAQAIVTSIPNAIYLKYRHTKITGTFLTVSVFCGSLDVLLCDSFHLSGILGFPMFVYMITG
jgi:hypothetical protein